MSFAAPTYAAAYSQAEQNANAVLIANAINLLITAIQKGQEASVTFQRPTQDTQVAVVAAKAARDAMP